MLLQFAFMKAAKRDERLMASLSENGLKIKFKNTIAALGGCLGLHTAAMMGFEGLSLGDAAWLTVTTASTTGYGDLSAHTALGRISTTILMYGAGIIALAQAGSAYLEYRQVKRDMLLNGKWKWKMDDHVIFLNSPKNNPNRYFSGLMSEFRRSAIPEAQRPALVVCSEMQQGLPDEVEKMKLAHVNHVVTEKIAFENSNIAKAAIIAVLSHDEHDALSDSVTFDLVARAREANPEAVIIAEVVSDENRKRIMAVGANQVVRPIRGYPELLVRAILAPGTEHVIEEMFNTHGDECITYDIPLRDKWMNIAMSCYSQDIGTPLGYTDMTGKVISNPNPNSQIEGKALLVLAREGNLKTDAEVVKILTPVNQTVGISSPQVA